jgi:ssRNA-specific RNase YbeY (16S rRNA maturation enzyme)
MNINIISSSRYKIERKKIKEFLLKIIGENAVEFSSLNIIFVGKRKMKMIAEKYKNEKAALPVLTFYYKEQNIGEIFICYPQMILLAAERNKTVDYILDFLLKHGIENLIKQQKEY